MPYRRALSPWSKCAPMGDAGSTLHKCARLAHLWRYAPCGDPQLCKAESAFPRMTTGTISGIMESSHVTRTPAIRIAPIRIGCGLARKGRHHESTFPHPVRREPGKGGALCLLRRSPAGHGPVETRLVFGVSAAGWHQRRSKFVSGLPPARHGASHRSRGKRSYVREPSTGLAFHRPASKSGIEDIREGQRQASSLARSSRWARADGRRDDL